MIGGRLAEEEPKSCRLSVLVVAGDRMFGSDRRELDRGKLKDD